MSNRIVLVISCLFFIVLQVQAGTIISHSGATDPESEGWTYGQGGTGTVGGVTHLGEASWLTVDTQGGTTWRYYYKDPTAADFDDPNGWTVSWRLSAENLKASNLGSDECGVKIYDGHRFIHFRYFAGTDGQGPCEMWNITGDLHRVTYIPQIVDREFGWHDFAVSFDPGTGEYLVYFDGGLMESSTTLGVENTYARVQWGALGGGSNDPIDVSSYWSSVIFETGQYDAVSKCGDINHPYPYADFTEDCVVDYLDLAVMVENWLECTDPECI